MEKKVMKNKKSTNHENLSLRVAEGLLLFDVWLLVKARWLVNNVFNLFIPILKILLVMFIGAGLLIIYAFVHSDVEYSNQRTNYYKTTDQVAGKYLEIDDHSEVNAVSLQKELIKIKSDAMNLEKSLHRMHLHLRNLYERQTNTHLADFASEAAGGLVIDIPDTESYSDPVLKQITLFGIPIWRQKYFTPRKVIQPWTQAGECWAFKGSHGKVEIDLAHFAIIDRVTLEHIPASASILGNINSAPKSFTVLGKFEDQFLTIGSFMYQEKGLSSQNFKITNPEMKKIPFKRIILEILSNWGNPNYTCIYRFKVHGKLYTSSNEDNKFNKNASTSSTIIM